MQGFSSFLQFRQGGPLVLEQLLCRSKDFRVRMLERQHIAHDLLVFSSLTVRPCAFAARARLLLQCQCVDVAVDIAALLSRSRGLQGNEVVENLATFRAKVEAERASLDDLGDELHQNVAGASRLTAQRNATVSRPHGHAPVLY